MVQCWLSKKMKLRMKAMREGILTERKEPKENEGGRIAYEWKRFRESCE